MDNHHSYNLEFKRIIGEQLLYLYTNKKHIFLSYFEIVLQGDKKNQICHERVRQYYSHFSKSSSAGCIRYILIYILTKAFTFQRATVQEFPSFFTKVPNVASCLRAIPEVDETRESFRKHDPHFRPKLAFF